MCFTKDLALFLVNGLKPSLRNWTKWQVITIFELITSNLAHWACVIIFAQGESGPIFSSAVPDLLALNNVFRPEGYPLAILPFVIGTTESCLCSIALKGHSRVRATVASTASNQVHSLPEYYGQQDFLHHSTMDLSWVSLLMMMSTHLPLLVMRNQQAW